MYCSKCGSLNPDDAQFCIACGAKIINPESSSDQSTTVHFSPTQAMPKKKVNPLFIALPIVAAVVVAVIILFINISASGAAIKIGNFKRAAQKNGYTVETGSAKQYKDFLTKESIFASLDEWASEEDLRSDYKLPISSINNVGVAVLKADEDDIEWYSFTPDDEDYYSEIIYISFKDNYSVKETIDYFNDLCYATWEEQLPFTDVKKDVKYADLDGLEIYYGDKFMILTMVKDSGSGFMELGSKPNHLVMEELGIE